MSDTRILAEKSLVATCALIAVMPCRAESNLVTWLACLKDVLPETTDCSYPLNRLHTAAANLIIAKPGRQRSNRLTRLGHEVSHYYGLAAAARYEAWQVSDSDRVVKP